MKRFAWPALTMVAAVFLSAGGSDARAEIREESWEFEVLLGYYSPGPDFLDSDTTFGFRLNFNVNQRFNIGFEVENVDTTGSPPPTNLKVDYAATLINFTGAYQWFPQKRWVTEARAGLGWTLVDATASDFPSPSLTDDTFSAMIGVGEKIDLTYSTFLHFAVVGRWFEQRVDDEWDSEISLAIGWKLGGQQ
jgi:hypothetical protein